jgi:hypothetical protein
VLTHWIEWLEAHETILWLMAFTSVTTTVVSIVVVCWLLVNLPEDYFLFEKRHAPMWAQLHPVLRGVLLVAKNMLGLVLIVTGMLLTLLPGQGLLTMLVGIMLLNFPGKYRLEQRLISYPGVRRSIDWLRRKAGRRPLLVEQR